jgi:hypothetical protein
MSTQDVPGANPRNLDELSEGCWGEAEDGSLIHVVGHEGGSVVYDIYDLAEDPPVFYRDAMIEDEFKESYSVPPTGTSDVPWTWHDKTTFPWDRVMKRVSSKQSNFAEVREQLSIAQRIAQKLGIKSRKLVEEEVTPQVEVRRRRGRAIIDRVAEAIGEIVER